MSKSSPTRRSQGSSMHSADKQEKLYGSVPDMTSSGGVQLRAGILDSQGDLPSDSGIDRMIGHLISRDPTESQEMIIQYMTDDKDFKEKERDIKHTVKETEKIDGKEGLKTLTILPDTSSGEVTENISTYLSAVSDNSEVVLQPSEVQDNKDGAQVQSSDEEKNVVDDEEDFDLTDDDEDDSSSDGESSFSILESIMTSTPIYKDKKFKFASLTPAPVFSGLTITPRKKEEEDVDFDNFAHQHQVKSAIMATKSEPIENIQHQKMETVEPERHKSEPATKNVDNGDPSTKPRTAPYPLGARDSMADRVTITPSDLLRKRQKIKADIKLSAVKKRSPLAADGNSGHLPNSKLSVGKSLESKNQDSQTSQESTSTELFKKDDQEKYFENADKTLNYEEVDHSTLPKLSGDVDDRGGHFEKTGRSAEHDVHYSTTSKLSAKVDQREVLEQSDKSTDLEYSTQSELSGKADQQEQPASKDQASKAEDYSLLSEIAQQMYGFISPIFQENIKENIESYQEDQKTSNKESGIPSPLLERPSESDKQNGSEADLVTDDKPIEVKNKEEIVQEGGSEIEKEIPLVPGSLPDKIETEKEALVAQEILDYTTPSELLKIRTGEDNTYITAEECKKVDVDDEAQDRYVELDYTTPSQLLMRKTQTGDLEEMFDYTTPSVLLKKHDEDSVREVHSLPDYTTPSRLLQKYVDREKSENVSRETPDYTSPSKLLLYHLGRQSECTSQEMLRGKSENISTEFPDHVTSSRSLQTKLPTQQVDQGQVFDYTTPSRLLQKRRDREKTDNFGKELPDYTTPSRLLTERVKPEDKEQLLDYTMPSRLQQERVDRKENKYKEKELPDYTTPSKGLDYTTPSRLLQKRVDREKTDNKGREFPDYTTPSRLFTKKVDREKTENMGKELPDYTTPSRLFTKNVDREKTENMGKEFPDYTTPSRLLTKNVDREKTENMGKELPDYTTPSRLLTKKIDREKTDNMGEELPDYTTPSRLLTKNINREKTDNMGEELPDYTTPSRLLTKNIDREKTDNMGEELPDYTTPSRLLTKNIDREKTDNMGEELPDYTTPSRLLTKNIDREKTENMGKELPDYTTPSRLFTKNIDREKTENMGKELPDYTTPSRLLTKNIDRENTDNVGKELRDYTTQFRKNENMKKKLPDHTTSSKLVQSQNKKDSDEASVVSLVDYTTPSRFLKKQIDQEFLAKSAKDLPDYTTPSVKLMKSINADKDQKSGVSLFDYTTPSELLLKRLQREMVDSKSRDLPTYTTPSVLLQKRSDRERSDKDNDKELIYTTPSRLLQKRTGRENQEKVTGEIPDYSTPSVLLKQRLESEKNASNTDEGYGSLNVSTQDVPLEKPGGGLKDDRKSSSKYQFKPDWSAQSDISLYFLNLSDVLRNTAMYMQGLSDPTLYFYDENLALEDEMTGKSQAEYKDDGQFISKTSYDFDHSTYDQSRSTSMSSWKESDYSVDGMEKKVHHWSRRVPKAGMSDKGDNSSKDSTKEKKSSFALTPNPSFVFESSDEENGIAEKQTLSRKDKMDSNEFLNSISSLNELFWSLYVCNPELTSKVMSSSDLSKLSADLLTQHKAQLSSCTSLDVVSQHAQQPLPASGKRPVPATGDGFSKKADDTNSLLSLNRKITRNHGNESWVMIAPDERNDDKWVMRHSSDLPRVSYRGRSDVGGQRKRMLPHTSGTRSLTPDARTFMMEREVMESQNRKLQMEISTLQTENKLLKEKYNRSTARINDLEEQLTSTQEELESLQDSLSQELSQVERKNKSEVAKDMDQLHSRVISLTRENESLKAEISGLEKQLDSANKVSGLTRQNAEKTKTMEAFRIETTALKDEVGRLKSLLEQSERHLAEEELRSRGSSQHVIKLTEMKNLLQQQLEMGGGGTVSEKQLKSLEKRLKITEERLHQERADRANNLSQVEDKLLTENARLQAKEKELNRQLQRERDKNRNLENKIKDVKEENEKLRLALPFDETSLTTQKSTYDIPYSVHTSQRMESVKLLDYKHIIAQIDKEYGLKPGQEQDIICQLWDTRDKAFKQLRHLEVLIQQLNLRDNNIAEGLKNLRDMKGQYETKTKLLEEKLEDSLSEKATLETTYKEQLSTLVTERHDAFARLKTLEDLMEATQKENEILRNNITALPTADISAAGGGGSGSTEALKAEIHNLESKSNQLLRSNKMLEAEMSTIKSQLEARNKALEDAQSDLDLAYNRLASDESNDWKQQKIDKLASQVNGLQTEIKLITDKYNVVSMEKSKAENELQALRHDITVSKSRHKDGRLGDAADSKVVQAMKEDVEERDRKITKLNQAYNEMESHFQQAKQELYIEQARANDLDAQIESLEQQLQYRSQILDTLTGTEKEQLAQFQILKDTLDSVSQELSQKQAQLKLAQIELSREKDKTEHLQHKLQDERKDRPDDTGERTLVGQELQIRQLQTEREQLKSELIEAHSDLTKAAEDFAAIENEVKKLNQELVNEKAAQLQLASEKGELEQHLEEIAEEHDALVQEKTQAEEDMVKLENKLQEILQKFEIESQQLHDSFSSRYQNIPPEAREMVAELESLRTLLQAKGKEQEVLTDKLSRQQRELEFLQRRVELLHNENQSNRDDIARMTSELATKMKESVSTREVNQFLVGERAKLQREKSQMEKDLDKERSLNERHKADIDDVIRKVEHSEHSYKSSVKEVGQKDLIIVNLQSELRDLQRTVQHLENENMQLTNKIERSNEDIKNLTAVKESLENRIESEKNMSTEEKIISSQRKDELSALNHQYEMLKQEQNITLNKLNTEKQAVDSLKERLQNQEEANDKLLQEVHSLTMELESVRSQLFVCQENLKDLRQDKDKIYKEYDSLCRSLTEKEKKITELEEKCDTTVQNLQREFTLQKHNIEKDKTSAERELDSAKEEINTLNEEIKQKESQLTTFGKTLKELEDVTREKNEFELQLKQLESSTGDCQLLLESHRKEIITLQHTVARQQENLSKVEMEKTVANEKLKEYKESSERQIQDMNSSLSQVKSQNEGEKIYLKDNLTQAQTRIESLETSLSSAIEARDKLQVSGRMTERSLDETKEHLQGEITGRKIAEQRAEALQAQLNDARKDRFLTEEKLSEARTKLSKLEKEHKSEKEKYKRLSEQHQELEAASYNNETNARSKSEQVDILQDEVNKLRQILENQKQQLNGKLKKTSLEYKQQLEIVEQERSKLLLQNQQLSQDLEHAREQAATKNKDNLKLQEEILTLEDQIRENSSKLRQAEDTLKAEEHLQTQLSSRFYAQEEELKQLKSFFARKVEESGDADKSMWQEMSHLLQSMSRQMQDHIESQKSTDKDRKDSEAKQVQKYKKQLSETESELNTEKALHQITKNSLQALEEDNKRLRLQLHTIRKRDTSSSDKKHKSRMEAINEIIARSQTQAQAMLAASGYFDDTLKSITSPRVDYKESPDNSLAEDFSFSSNAAYHPQVTSSPPSKVRKGHSGSPGRKSSP